MRRFALWILSSVAVVWTPRSRGFTCSTAPSPGRGRRSEYACRSDYTCSSSYSAGRSASKFPLVTRERVLAATEMTASSREKESRLAKEEESIEDVAVVLGRATEITSVLLRDVLMPLCASAAMRLSIRDGGGAVSGSDAPWWDELWSARFDHPIANGGGGGGGGGGSNSSVVARFQSPTNAERVVAAFEKLGPTFVKTGQAIASRPDIFPAPLAHALSALQDDMEPFDTDVARGIVRSELRGCCWVPEETVEGLLSSLDDTPVAAASIGQVYKGHLIGYGDVAVKVKRPGVEDVVRADGTLLRSVARLVQTFRVPRLVAEFFGAGDGSDSSSDRLVRTELVEGVDEFVTRLFEEMDYRREATNAKRFADLYSIDGGSVRRKLPNGKSIGVVVPKMVSEMCTDNVLVMEWIDGTSKLVTLPGDEPIEDTDGDGVTLTTREELSRTNLELVELGIHCTLSQLMDTGVLHADPHGGNLLKVKLPRAARGRNQYSLAYLDFGVLSTVPEQVRDGLVCAVAQLVFARDIERVASLFGELRLLPDEVLSSPSERAALVSDLGSLLDEALVYPEQGSDDSTSSKTSNTEPSNRNLRNNVPELRFDKLLEGLAGLLPKFRFQFPPYFLNNSRALGTLEGMARSLDRNFSLMQIVYPYALNRLLRNPSGSPVVERTLISLVSDSTGRMELRKVASLLRDASAITGFSRRKVLRDVVSTKAGRRFVLSVSSNEVRRRLSLITGSRRRSG